MGLQTERDRLGKSADEERWRGGAGWCNEQANYYQRKVFDDDKQDLDCSSIGIPAVVRVLFEYMYSMSCLKSFFVYSNDFPIHLLLHRT